MKRIISNFFRPLRNWKRQLFFKKKYGKCHKNVVILSNNCIGGVIYHDAKRPFFSPTINLTIVNDFLTFASNFTFYSKQPLEKVENPIECPRGIIRGNKNLPDINVKFTHYKTFDDAARKWNDRIKRITSDLPFYIIFTTDIFTKKDLNIFESIECNKKICIFKNTECKNVDDIIFVPIPKKFQNKDILKFESLTGGKRIFDNFIDLYFEIFVSNKK